MKVRGLKLEEKAALADFFESYEWKCLRKVLANQQLDLAQSAAYSPSMEVLAQIRGKIDFIKALETWLRKNHKENLPKQEV